MKKIMLIGNVGRNPEMRTDQAGNEFATFSLGVSVGTKQEPKTDWLDISCNGKLAEIVKSLVKKGSKVFIEGFPSVNDYSTREGKPAAVMKVYANNMELLNFVESEETPPTHEEGANNG